MRLDATDVRYAVPSPPSADKARLSVGNVLFTRYSGTRDFVGACAVVGADGAGLLHPDKLIRVEVNPDVVTPEFLVAAASSPAGRQWLEGVIKTTAGQTGLAGSDLKRLPVLLAPLAEQERIVAAIEEAFSKLDAGEAGLRTVRQLLKRMRGAILAAAVTGRLVPQAPADLPATKLLVDFGVESAGMGLYDLPDSWCWAELGDLLREPLRNGMSAPAEGAAHGLPTFSISAVTSGDFSEANIKYTTGDWRRASDLWAEPGDVFVQRSNTPELVGTARLYRGVPRAAIFPDLLIRIRPIELLRPQWLETFMGSRPCRDHLRGQAKGLAGSMPKISQPVLLKLPIPVAPLEEQDRIIVETERQFSFLDACERAVDVGLARAAALRRSVLKAAFEGKLVPQDPSDEPASALLERIRAERLAASTPGNRRERTTE